MFTIYLLMRLSWSVLVAEELSIRRTAASNIYNCGAGIKLTADILGHESLDSTTHYVRVDFTALREICHEWPGKGAAK